jgi:uncharacterized DUF497 family protein
MDVALEKTYRLRRSVDTCMSYIRCICSLQMDVLFLLQDQQFVWDSHKASANLSKHGVSFELACQVFFDPFLRLQDATDGDEPREAATGLTEDWTLLFVVHAIRERDVIRIISARPATPEERRAYEEYE